MTGADKISPDIIAYWFAVVLVFAVIGMYGRQAMEWLLMKLYEFFIQRNPEKS